MATFTVKDVRRVPSPDEGRAGQMDTLVTYELDPFRVYMVKIPKSELTEADVVEAVKKDLEGIQRFIGKELQL